MCKTFGRRCLSLRQKKSKNLFAKKKKKKKNALAREEEERESTVRIATAQIVTSQTPWINFYDYPNWINWILRQMFIFGLRVRLVELQLLKNILKRICAIFGMTARNHSSKNNSEFFGQSRFDQLTIRPNGR